MDIDYSSLSDQELSQMLKDYGVAVGPINAATRSTYERKLQKLKTGQSAGPSQKYEPVVDDEEDDTDQVIQFKTQKPSPKPQKPSPKPKASVPTPNAERIIPPAPLPTEPRLRRDLNDSYSPRVESRPALASARKTTMSYEPRYLDKESSSSETKSDTGLPLWVKLFPIIVVVILIYLIYSNMESNIDANIPKIPNKVEV